MTDKQWVKQPEFRRVILNFLTAYYEDLKYQLDHPSYGISFMNTASCGTRCFETHEEADEYVETLAAFIQDLEEA